MSGYHKPKSITLTKSKSNGATKTEAPQPLSAQQRATKFAPLEAKSTSSARSERSHHHSHSSRREERYEVEEREEEEEEERRSRSSSKARSEEEEEEYEQDDQSPARRSPSPVKQRRPRTPPHSSSSKHRDSKHSSKEKEAVKEAPARGLGREFSSLLLQNIPRHLEATDLFLNVFDAADDAAEIEMHTHEDGTPTGTAQMYFEREGAAEAAQRRHNGQVVEGKVLRMLVIKAVSKVNNKAAPLVMTQPATAIVPKRKRDASSSPQRRPQASRAPTESQSRKLTRTEPPLVKPAPAVKPLTKQPDLARKQPIKEPLAKPKAANGRSTSQLAWAVEDSSDAIVGFAEHDEPERNHRTPEVVRPRVTKPKVEQASSVQVVHRDGRPQVTLSKNKYNR